MVFITGSVAKQGSLTLMENVTLSHAIALAGGSSGGASLDRVKIMRPDPAGGEPVIIVADVVAIRDGLAPDIALKANDVIHVDGAGLARRAWGGVVHYLQVVVGLGLRVF